MNNNIKFYDENKDDLIDQYDSVEFEAVHSDWLQLLPESGNVLDIGAGSGRDARYLAKKGLNVTAVEPSLPLLNAARKNSQEFDIDWLNDCLPDLSLAFKSNKRFDFVLLSAVWMHLNSNERMTSMKSMANLLSEQGRIVITLRYGGFSDGRIAYPLSSDEVKALGSKNGLVTILESNVSADALGRGDVVWQTVALSK